MTHEIKVVAVPPVWVRPSDEAFEAAKARFLAGEEDEPFKVEVKEPEDVDF